jgi:phosphoglycolate phosphatase
LNGVSELALFDLDGTLVDSAPDITAAVDSALHSAGLSPIGEARVRGYIGDGAAQLMHRAVTGEMDGVAPQHVFEPIFARFLKAYAAQLFDLSSVYPHVVETLLSLSNRGWRLACITNKPERFTTPVLVAAGLSAFFEVVVSGDTLAAKKPDPAPLLYAAAACRTDIAMVTMIGDSVTDLKAAQNAGVRAIAVDYGYSQGIDLTKHGAYAVISDISALPEILARPRARQA